MGKKSSGRGCKMANGGMVAPQSWQEKLAEVRAKVPKQAISQPASYADGGMPMDEQINRFASGIQSAPSVLGANTSTAGVGSFSGPGEGFPAPSGLAGMAAPAPTTNDQQVPVAQTTAAVTPQTASMGNPFKFGAGSSTPLTDFKPLTDFAPLVSQQVGAPRSAAQPVDALLPGQAASSMDAFGATKKRSLAPGFADGGKVDPVEELLRRTQQKYGTAPATPEPVQQRPVQQPVAQPAQQQPVAQQTLPASIANRNDQMRKIANYADGGMVRFAGKGGPREDKIPVKVAGADIKVSDGEQAVILPAKTAANPAAVQAIGQIIQQSNDGRAPKGGMVDGGSYRDGANGLTPAQLAALQYQQRTGQNAPEGANPLPAPIGVTGDFQNGATGNIPPVDYAGQLGSPANAPTDPEKYPYTGQKGQNPYRDASFPGMAAVVTPNATANPTSPTTASGYGGVMGSGPAAQAVQRNPTGYGVGQVVATNPGMAHQAIIDKAPAVQPWWAGTDTRNESTGLEQERARAAAGMSLSDSLRKMNGPSLVTDAVLGKGNAPTNRAATQQATHSNEGRPSAVQSAGMAAQAIANAPDPRIAANTGNAGNARFNEDTGTISFTDKGFNPTRQKMADGTGALTRANGQTQVFTSMSPNQYVGADGTPNQPWEKTAQYQQAIAQNQKDKDNLLSLQTENAYRDATSENRYQRDMGARQMQAIGALQGMAGQSLAQASKRQEIDANAPDQNRQLAGQKIAEAQMTAQDRQELRDLYAAHAAASPEDAPAIAEKIRVRTGKDKGQHYKAAILNGAKSIDGNEADRGYLINEMTGEMRPMAASAPAVATPNKMAIDYLKANPKAAADFDAKYGQGAAKQILGK